MNELTFSITFHGPFHIATGANRDGITTSQENEPLPATSLKGVIRASAKRLLGKDSPLIDDVFGAGRVPSPWRWSPAEPDKRPWAKRPEARVSIDPTTGAARNDMLAFAEHTQAAHASFTITQFGFIERDDLDLHRGVLAISAQAVRSIGALRRRGLGWVSIQCTNFEPGPEDVRAFLQRRSA